MSVPSLRQCVGALIVIFIVYAVLTEPEQASRVAGDLVDVIENGFSSLTEFFDGLLG